MEIENQKNINEVFIKKFQAQEEKIKKLEKTIETILIRLDNQETLIKSLTDKKNKIIHTFVSV